MNPTSLPLELWDEIAHFIASISDLLSLALVCRDLSAIVLPHHIHYRRIRCDISRINVWEHLAKHRRRARGIRSVELVDEKEKDIRLPPTLINTTVNSADFDPFITSSLLSSLSHMIALEGFEWHSAPPHHVHDISRILVDRAICLRALAIVFICPPDEDGSNISGYKDTLHSLPLWNLCNLTRVMLNDICEPAQEMLIHKCPNLEDLFLYGTSYGNSHCSAILETGTWPKRRRLTLRGLLTFSPASTTSSQQNTIAISFLRQHANLECLQCESSSFPARPSRRDLSSLPDLKMLRSLYWSGVMTSKPSFFLSKSCLSRLVHYKAGAYEFDATLNMHRLETFRLRFYNWVPSKLPQFLKNAPNLQKLSLEGILFPMETQRLLAVITSCITNITHLYLFALEFTELSKVEGFVHVLSQVKTLRYIGASFDGSMIYVEIVRDPAGNYLKHSFIPSVSLSEIGQDPSEWGDFFVGL